MPRREPASNFVRLATKDTRKGKSTFRPDFKNNPLHRILKNVAEQNKVVLDLTGVDRSDKAIDEGLSTTRHFDQNAVDVSFRRNPSWFHINGTPKGPGKKLIREALRAGFRVFDGDGHLHIDKFQVGEVDDFPQIHREPKGLGNIEAFANEAFSNIQNPKTFADFILNSKEVEAEEPAVKSQSFRDFILSQPQ
ncbi:hypothetical protein [Zhongshania sp.]|uniref:hypothetical protein n=1 Tax=Zhongshania sp. TaxID=1971902 RepID=UPI0035682475